jgi:hypothetical protein
MSEPLYRQLDAGLRDRAVPTEQELEELGRVPLYFVALDELPIELPAVAEPTRQARVRETIGFGIRAFPRLIGLRPAPRVER